MIPLLLSHPMTVLAAAICGLALFKGGPAERGAGALIGATWIVSMVAQLICTRAWLDHAMVAEPYMIAGVDTLCGVGFVVLALRHSTLWLSLEVLIQGAALAVHAAFLGGDGLNGPVYVTRVNALGGLLLLVLLTATVAGWVRRGQATRALDRMSLAQ